MEAPSSLTRCDSLLARTITSKEPAIRWPRRFLAALLCAAGLISIAFASQSLQEPRVYMKDFVQEYLLARAVLTMRFPYAPVSDLARQLIGPTQVPLFPHPTPHPPPVAVIALPLGLLGYQEAASVWFVFEIACVLASVCLIFDGLAPGSHLLVWILSSLAVFLWNPLWEGLIVGQLMTFLLLLVVLAWRALRSRKSGLAGIILGLVVALKLIGWPLLLFLAVRRDFRALGAAITSFLLANVAAALLMGYEVILYYYLRVGGLVSSLYRAQASNFSLWSVGWRLFSGTGAAVLSGAEAPAVFQSVILSSVVAVAAPLLLLVVGLALARKSDRFDISFSIMLCVSLLVNPIAWMHYLALSLLALGVIVSLLVQRCFPKLETWVAILCGLLLLVTPRQWHDWAVAVGTRTAIGNVPVVNPWILTVFTMMPAMLVLTLIWLLYQLGRNAVPESDRTLPEFPI